jgi:hypothetical protein
MAIWAEDEDVVCIHPDGQRLTGFAAQIRDGWRQPLRQRPARLSVRIGDAVSAWLRASMLAVAQRARALLGRRRGPGSAASARSLVTNVYHARQPTAGACSPTTLPAPRCRRRQWRQRRGSPSPGSCTDGPSAGLHARPGGCPAATCPDDLARLHDQGRRRPAYRARALGNARRRFHRRGLAGRPDRGGPAPGPSALPAAPGGALPRPGGQFGSATTPQPSCRLPPPPAAGAASCHTSAAARGDTEPPAARLPLRRLRRDRLDPAPPARSAFRASGPGVRLPGSPSAATPC